MIPVKGRMEGEVAERLDFKILISCGAIPMGSREIWEWSHEPSVFDAFHHLRGVVAPSTYEACRI